METFEIPNLDNYLDSINEFVTKSSDTYYIKFNRISPSKIQIDKIYYIKIDDDESKTKFMKEFKNTKHYIYNIKDVPKGTPTWLAIAASRRTLFKVESQLLDDKIKRDITSVFRLPYKVY